jgi:hypothetical protein
MFFMLFETIFCCYCCQFLSSWKLRGAVRCCHRCSSRLLTSGLHFSFFGARSHSTHLWHSLFSEDRTFRDKLRWTERSTYRVYGCRVGQADVVGRPALPYMSCRWVHWLPWAARCPAATEVKLYVEEIVSEGHFCIVTQSWISPPDDWSVNMSLWLHRYIIVEADRVQINTNNSWVKQQFTVTNKR